MIINNKIQLQGSGSMGAVGANYLKRQTASSAKDDRNW